MQNSDIKNEFSQRLKAVSLKVTPARLEIFTILSQSNSPMTIQEIVASGSSAHFVSIYRSIDAMHKAGILKQIPRGFKNCFELSDEFKPHHHHVTCEICGKSKDIESKSVEEILRKLTEKAGLTPTKHHFELFGICRDCRTKATKLD